MTRRPAIDVSTLPTAKFGTETAVFWGVLALIAIESTVYVLLIASYYYVKPHQSVFPPTPLEGKLLVLAWANFAVLLLSAWPMHLAAKAALKADVHAILLWIVVNTFLAAVFTAGRIVELKWLPFRWDIHAFGSMVWFFLGLHFFHALSGVLENLVFIVLLLRPRKLEKKHMADVRVNALYWYFVVVAYIAIFAVVYVDPVFFGHKP